MTVNELIQQLQTYPGDMRVLTLGYEGGYNDMDLKTDGVVFDYNSEDTWYYGPHESANNRFVQDEKCLIVTRGK